MKDFFDFIVGVLNAIALPAVVFGAYFFFKDELKSFLSRLIAGEMLGAKVKLQSEQEYAAGVDKIETAKDAEERQKIAQDLIEPKNETITTEEGAQLVTKEMLKRMNTHFTITEFNSQFDQLFSSAPNQLNSGGIKQFKSMVSQNLRESLQVVERNDNGVLSYTKISAL